MTYTIDNLIYKAILAFICFVDELCLIRSYLSTNSSVIYHVIIKALYFHTLWDAIYVVVLGACHIGSYLSRTCSVTQLS